MSITTPLQMHYLHKLYHYICSPVPRLLHYISTFQWGRRGRDNMIVGFTTTYAISAYHH